MELGSQIRYYRNKLDISQERLAEKIYVSRQSISNWETNKNYPDVNSLIRLSEVFNISLDILMKGDLEKMKKEISEKDQKDFGKYSNIIAVLFGLLILTPAPLLFFLKKLGIAIWIVLAIITMYAAILVEKKKKKLDIHTYREIIAFREGKNLEEILKAREEGKRKNQKTLISIIFAVITLLLAIFIMSLTNIFF
ncbi:MAG: helix-turn-helix transcriptional regulator [Clostridium sp.]|nr:helix-turn-helix transcriptional regulator [Clostridium sp.]